MRHVVLLLCCVLIGGTSAVAQAAPASKAAHPANPAKVVVPVLPAHPMTVAQAKEMLKLTGANESARQAIARELGNLRQAFPPYMPEDVIQDLKTGFEHIDFGGLLIPIYQKTLSEKDAAAIIAFYKTPAGQHLVAATPEIQKEAFEAGVEAGEKVARQVLESHAIEIRAAAQRYKELHSLSLPK